MRRGLTLAAAVLVTALVVAAYGPAVDTAAGFVSDDFMILQRVRDAGGLADARSYFSESYYEYYRPLAFLAFAADWTWWGADARASHAVSVLLHVLNTLLVLVLAARLAGLQAGVIAAALFGVHVAHHEAVYWFAARFDLLATAGVLAALVALTSRQRAAAALTGLFFFAALLAKESAVTFPIVAAAAVLLIQGGSVRRVGRLLVWLGALAAVYVVMRQASGLPSMGGAARLPKLAALGALPLLLLAAAHPAAQPLLAWVRRRAWWWGAAGVALAAAAAFWASSGQPGAGALRGALAAAGFAAAHTFSPVALDQALMPLPSWMAAVGAVAVALAALVGSAVCRSRVPAFLMWFALAAYIPVSSMTEGTRYLYLPFVPIAVGLGLVAAWADVRWPRAVRALVAVVVIAGVWQVRAKGADWNWAADMTRRAASVIAAEAEPCASHDIVLATAPTRVRGVYCNLNYEGLRWLQSCEPRRFLTLIRLGIDAPTVSTQWPSAVALRLHVRDYRGDFVTSADLSSFQERIPAKTPMALRNALGGLTSWADGSDLHLTQNLSGAEGWNARWFVFSAGELRPISRD